MYRKKFSLVDLLIYLLISLFALACVAPFVYVISVSFTDPSVYVPYQFTLIPKKFSLTVYESILKTKDFVIALKNTVIVTVSATVLGIFTTFGFGYGLSKKHLVGHKFLIGVVIFALLFDCGMIPNYMNIRNLGLLNSYWSLILTMLASAYNVVIVKTFLGNIPAELEEAATIDGANTFVTFFRIVLPLSLASLATIALFMAVDCWNMYVKPMLYVSDSKLRTLQIYIKTVLVDAATESAADGNIVMPSETVRLATVVLSIAPIMCVYPFVQRFFVKGVMIGSVKG
ncbi:MAG: carbohydrate ABC transporter permease [Eubacteriales bacterium]|nr:carbohydrate ABC transporter permease [Eubacteriales bacterium]